MTTPKWQAGKLYPTGSLVQPKTTAPAGALTPLTNPGFETGDLTGWQVVGSVAVSSEHFGGAFGAHMTGSSGQARVISTDLKPVTPGMSITGTAQYKQGAASSGKNTGCVILWWYDAGLAQIPREDMGNLVTSGKNGAWHLSTVNAVAPAGAAFVVVGGLSNRSDSDGSSFDDFTISNHMATVTEGLVYRAVQPAAGLSGAIEPVWPTVNGVQVIDNEVIWEAVIGTRLTWQARPILKSGPTEPAWNDAVGSITEDNTIAWVADDRSIKDPNCPASDIVVIGASKVHVGDNDIDRYSATVNPLDFTTPDDAGYLATGLQQYGANPIAGMGLYRGNLVAFNSEAFQMWQIDEDPANMALLDALPIGCTRHHAITPVSNDLFFLSAQGVRTIGIAGASTNLQTGDVGMPIDPLVQAAMAVIDAAGDEALGLYYPAAGQYWLIFPDTDANTSEVFVYTMTKLGGVGAWSRYTFPYAIEDWALKGDDLFVRSVNKVFRISDSLLGDTLEADADPVPFQGVIQWPWLDFGNPGVTKMMVGFDCVCDGNPEVSFGYDQTDQAAFTTPYAIPADTVPGMVIPMPLAAPSLSCKLTFDGTESWHFRALTLYLNDNRMTS